MVGYSCWGVGDGNGRGLMVGLLCVRVLVLMEGKSAERQNHASIVLNRGRRVNRGIDRIVCVRKTCHGR